MATRNPIVVQSGSLECRWIRPDWFLTEPTIGSTEKVIYLLNRITEDGFNYIRLQVAGDFTVDWGDGNIIDYASGTIVEYDVDFSGVSNTIGGSTDKMHWIKIIPQSGDITTFSINAVKTTTLQSGAACNQGVLEVLLGTINIVGTYAFYLANMTNLKHINIVNALNITYNLQSALAYNYALEKIQGYFSSILSNLGAFYQCYSLWDIQDFTFECSSSVTAQNAFNGTGLKNIDLSDLNFNVGRGMFYGAKQLEELTLNFTYAYFLYQFATFASNLGNINISSGDGSLIENVYQAFDGCDFTETPAINLISCTSAGSMFDDNYNLKKINLYNIQTTIGFNNCNLDHTEIERAVDNGQFLLSASGYTVDFRKNPDIANLSAAIIAKYTALNITLLLT